MADRKRVLITGVSGQIGGVVRDALKDIHDVAGIDIRAPQDFEATVADMTDLEAILPAFEGIDTVVD
ncbi:MAG: NAD(P)-dependent oxidoreductase, partial [Chloroflexota bacterium]|nr:NAD(P)-dependent oxidoreductase [Chloroflexota bacterium]